MIYSPFMHTMHCVSFASRVLDVLISPGPVAYGTNGWIDKNNDSLVPEVEAVLADAEKPFIQGMADLSRAASGEPRLQKGFKITIYRSFMLFCLHVWVVSAS